MRNMELILCLEKQKQRDLQRVSITPNQKINKDEK